MTATDAHRDQADQPAKITRDDIEAKFRELTGEVEDRAEAARSTAVTIGAVLAVTVVVGVFLFGRRRGRKSTTIVEVRRF
ncbi:MAG: hypothetical protein R2746_09280 [Acidimicrobiales bacterium]|nr:hypothetical protein [Actinomycetota bacterium]